MITDRQTRLLRQKRMEGKTQETAGAKAGMSVRSARKWQSGPFPSQAKPEHRWRTRPDPFDGVWEDEIEPLLRNDPTGKLKATTIIDWLAEQHPGRFPAAVSAKWWRVSSYGGARCNDDYRIGVWTGAAWGPDRRGVLRRLQDWRALEQLQPSSPLRTHCRAGRPSGLPRWPTGRSSGVRGPGDPTQLILIRRDAKPSSTSPTAGNSGCPSRASPTPTCCSS